MSKQISQKELAEAVSKLLTDPEAAGELESSTAFAGFMTAIAEVVCDYCGGEVQQQADNTTGDFLVGIHANDSLQEGGGIWANYDPDGDLFS
ncbi:hypothetical protein NPS53_09375 [Pseudomonas putida]|uniref:hypothetical protein n=1 Tax=Pseudomonas putida TaxID=303 RepID=UPI00236466FB|nr:hypothetical protein [Pseudomonas putida]MDD2139787.1 hypothetical protein [Pseudomonas putida]HDS1721711.1 hypothetical protein [Pseudomonas putida]